MLDSVIRANKNIIPKHSWKSANMKKKKKMENLINDDLDVSSSDESDSESDNEFDNGSDNDESSD